MVDGVDEVVTCGRSQWCWKLLLFLYPLVSLTELKLLNADLLNLNHSPRECSGTLLNSNHLLYFKVECGMTLILMQSIRRRCLVTCDNC